LDTKSNGEKIVSTNVFKNVILMGLTAFDNLILSLHMTPLGITPKEDYIFFMNTTTKTKVKRRSNGEGSITKLKNGRYMGKIMLGRKADGKPNRKTVYGETQTEVLKKINELIYEYNNGLYVEPNRLKFGEWLLIWLRTFKKKKLKARTYDTYESQINARIIPVLGHLSLKDITSFHIQDFYNELGDNDFSSATIRKTHQIINSALDKAQEQKMIRFNPATSIELPPLEQKPVRAFSRDEQTIFFEAAKLYSYYEAYVFAVDTGVRDGELFPLTWSDIDFEKGYVQINKTLIVVKDREKKSGNSYILKVQDSTKTKAGVRKIPLTKRCLRMLKELKLKNGTKGQLVFPSKNNTFINPRNFLRCFKTICKKAGLDDSFNCHTLRHTFATRCFEKGIPVKIVSRWLGHKKVQHTLDIYTHVMPDEEKRAIERLENDIESLEVAPPEYIKITQ
jgi:integrase